MLCGVPVKPWLISTPVRPVAPSPSAANGSAPARIGTRDLLCVLAGLILPWPVASWRAPGLPSHPGTGCFPTRGPAIVARVRPGLWSRHPEQFGDLCWRPLSAVLVPEDHRARPMVEGDLATVRGGRREHPGDRRRDPGQQPPLLLRLLLHAAGDQAAGHVPRQ